MQESAAGLPGQIAMQDLCRKAVLRQRAPYRFGEHHGTVPSACAAERDRQVAFPFPDIVRNQKIKQAFDAAQKFARLRERPDVARHALVLAGKTPQLRNKMGIRQKAHIENQVGVHRHAVAIAETHERNQQRLLPARAETLRDELAEFVNIESRCINHEVRDFPDGRHQLAFLAKADAHGLVMAERMRPTRFTKPAQQ